ncbi:AT-hook motif nuclear-localized protein 14 isoform X2 [Gossypium hirsutum]|uniref:AT-hook motif nuclear-localized protein n=1 Tax=Gossypium hirsutum TaxID=3635 RepID=A0A1U8LJB4_GOSHI|nr:AT-hook motif nuclear-localized protein 14 isoform X2 [Gossypium hirsutum]
MRWDTIGFIYSLGVFGKKNQNFFFRCFFGEIREPFVANLLELGLLFGALREKRMLVCCGNAGQGFTPHVINVVAGEDVGQKIMLFMQQSKRELCILSASGTISNASLRQPATSGGNIAYEGRFEIISLSGSYVRTEIGGRTGGLSVCLSSADGQIIGGGVGGPLKAAGPVQVIVGTFMVDNKKDGSANVKGDASGSKLPSPVAGTSVSNIGFRPAFEASGRNPIDGNDDHQSFGGSHFMMQPQGLHLAPRPTDWRTGLDDRTGFELTGKTGHGAHQSPENGDYD